MVKDQNKKNVPSVLTVNDYLLKALVLAVAKLPRNMNTRVKPERRFRGVLQQAVEATFYSIMEKVKHELANADNPKCTATDRCLACRKDVFILHVETAEEAGLIFREKKDKGDVYYTPEEMQNSHRKESIEVAEQIVGELAK